jgi:hypothetical protein
MAFNFGDVRRSLKKKGFVEDSDSHHIYLHHVHDGQRTGPYTYVSHGKSKEDVGHGMEAAMKQQLRLRTAQEVRRLVECPMSAAE